jgi:hypothetical protein
MMLNVDPATVAASAATEEGVSAGIAASASAAAATLTAVLPMGADLDSIAFAAALNAAGASYVCTASEHVANRTMLAGAQDMAASTYSVTEAIRDTALAL